MHCGASCWIPTDNDVKIDIWECDFFHIDAEAVYIVFAFFQVPGVRSEKRPLALIASSHEKRRPLGSNFSIASVYFPILLRSYGGNYSQGRRKINERGACQANLPSGV